MALILNIETATNVCSVSLAENGENLVYKEHYEGPSHARFLTTLISECLKEINKDFSNIDAIAVSKGPGSYTGLRIGVATAKGLCYALEKPLLSVNTLLSMTSFLLSNDKFESNVLLCPMIDARRMEVYTAIFDKELNIMQDTSAEIIDNHSFEKYIPTYELVFFGDGSPKLKSIFSGRENIRFIDDFLPSARGMSQISFKSYMENTFESVEYFEPFYLKDFYDPKQLL